MWNFTHKFKTVTLFLQWIITIAQTLHSDFRYRMELDGLEFVQLQGWIRTNRSSGKLGFIELNDGTYFRNRLLHISPIQLHRCSPPSLRSTFHQL